MNKRLANLFLAVSTLAVCLFLADVAFRLYERQALTASYRPSGPVVDLQALNYNDSSLPKAKPEGEFRILSFGDSFCYSIVSFPFSYNGVIQRLLSAPGRPARCVNFGEPSSSFPQYLTSMANWGPQLEHDAILVSVFLGNDLTEVAYGVTPDDGVVNRALGDNFLEVQTGRRRLRHVPRKFPLRMADFAWAYWLVWRDGLYLVRDVPAPYLITLGPLEEKTFQRVTAKHLEACEPGKVAALEAGYKGVEALARSLARQRERGVKVLVALFPSEIQVDGELFRAITASQGLDPAAYDLDLPNRLVRQRIAAVDPQLPVLDLTPRFRQAVAAGARLYYPMETHWNVEGNQLAGEILAGWMAEHWLKNSP